MVEAQSASIPFVKPTLGQTDQQFILQWAVPTDPDGDEVTAVQWKLLEQPEGSKATAANIIAYTPPAPASTTPCSAGGTSSGSASGSTALDEMRYAAFGPDLGGDYLLEATVSDGCNSVSRRVRVSIECGARQPVAVVARIASPSNIAEFTSGYVVLDARDSERFNREYRDAAGAVSSYAHDYEWDVAGLAVGEDQAGV
jgi:hypothetical protein